MLSARVREQLRGTLNLREWGRWWQDRSELHPLAVGACILLPFVIATAVYLPFLRQWFVSDDFIWLHAAANPDVPGFLKDALNPRGPTPYWRPLTDIYFFCMYRVFSLHTAPYHVANLLIHGTVAAGTVLFVRRLSRSLVTGLLAGVLFAVSPAYGIAVSWVSSVTELMSTLLALATVLLYLKFLDDDNRSVLALAACTFVAASLVHEGAAAVPAILTVLGLAIRAPQDRAELKRLALTLLPFIGVGSLYAVAQVARLYVGSHRDYLAGNLGHVLDRLLHQLRWVSLPLSPSHGTWLDVAQWTLLLVLALVACLYLFRRSWEQPALFACIVFALLPSSVLTFAFDPRWTYFSVVFWAAFAAMLIASIVRWLWSYNGVAGVAVLGVFLAGVGSVLIPETRDNQRPLVAAAAQMEQLSRAIRTGCPALGPGKTAYIRSLPFTDPGNTVPPLIGLLGRGTLVITGDAASEQPAAGDCVIEWSAEMFQATEVSGGP